jgi:hypothetical protein
MNLSLKRDCVMFAVAQLVAYVLIAWVILQLGGS